jgi:hypothetical protein
MKAALAASAGAVALALALPAGAVAVPQAKTDHGVTYVSGGIGHDEAAAMRAEAKRYPLSMVFSAGKHNEYLAGVKVKLEDKSGKVVLNEVADGPIMLVKVPAGRYTIEATRDGKTEHRTVEVPAKGDRQVAFHWPAA